MDCVFCHCPLELPVQRICPHCRQPILGPIQRPASAFQLPPQIVTKFLTHWPYVIVMDKASYGVRKTIEILPFDIAIRQARRMRQRWEIRQVHDDAPDREILLAGRPGDRPARYLACYLGQEFAANSLWTASQWLRLKAPQQTAEKIWYFQPYPIYHWKILDVLRRPLNP